MPQKLLLIPVLLGSMWLSACNALRVYTIDLPQGNAITQEMAELSRSILAIDRVTQVIRGISESDGEYDRGAHLQIDTQDRKSTRLNSSH